MLTAIKRRTDREDDGFTLIELMVVVLIIAILLAIAIPTFLGARDSANARAAQSNLRNALTAEQTEWTNAQAFSGTGTATTTMSGIEQGINWTTTAPVSTQPNQVFAVTNSAADEVVLEATGKDGNCYLILQSDNAQHSFTGYSEYSGVCNSTVPAAANMPVNSGTGTIQSITAGSATTQLSSTSVSNSLPSAWYTSF